MSRFRFSLIGLKLALLGSLLTLAVIVSMAQALLRQAEAGLVAQMLLRAEAYARACREGMLPSIDPFALHFATHETRKEAAVASAELLGLDGKVLSHTDLGRIGEKGSAESGRALAIASPLALRRAQGGYEIAAPVLAGERRLGAVRVVLTRQSIGRALGAMRRGVYGLAALATALNLIGVLLLIGWILRERERIRGLFGRFVPPEVVEGLVSGQVQLGGKRAEVTILMSDIRGFTRLSERMQPEQVVRFLNDYFSRMVEIVTRHGGSIDKFIGDGMLAVFGAPLALPDHAARAVQCALDMQACMVDFNKELLATNREPVRIGIAINTGVAVAGTIGSKERMEYTVVGDTVNVAARLESLNLRLRTEMLVTESSYAATQRLFNFKGHGLVTVRGHEAPVGVYELLGAKRGARLETPLPARRMLTPV